MRTILTSIISYLFFLYWKRLNNYLGIEFIGGHLSLSG